MTTTFSLLNLYQAIRFVYISDESIQEVTIHEPQKHGGIPEALVHDIWKHQRFDTQNLNTIQGHKLRILDVGMHNEYGSGADFRQAHIVLDNLEWHGDIEIHLRSADWRTHQHEHDAAYNRVVLHVALFDDAYSGTLKTANESELPELILVPYLQENIRELLYQFYTHPDQDFLCQSQWKHVPNELLNSYIPQLGYERLHEKAHRWHGRSDFSQQLYEQVFRTLGYSQNQNAMLALAQKVPLEMLQSLVRLKDREALLLGAAGLLPSTEELLDCDKETAETIIDWHERFAQLQHRHDITPMNAHQWHFSGLRPANFPTLRLAQAASLFQRNGLFDGDVADNLLNALHERKPLHTLRSLLQTSPSEFWNTHFHMATSAKSASASIGTDRANIMLINAILPAFLYLANYEELPHLRAVAFDLLKQLPKSEDHITKHFTHASWKPRHAADYQGLHQLFRTRCQLQTCLSCDIGKHWLEKT